MKLVSFRSASGGDVRVGEVQDGAVLELGGASMLEWLAGSGHERTGAEHALTDVSLVSPVPVPTSFRDFMTFEDHARRAFAGVLDDPDHQVPEYWYAAPAFYYGNTSGWYGTNEPVPYPDDVEWLDYELETAAVIGQNGEIAGYTLLNDWSARDVQRKEATVNLGLHKSKDFAYSLGPWLVTPDELEFQNGRLIVDAEVDLNGETLVRTSSRDQYFTWEQIAANAGKNTTLAPGAILGSGTMPGGSLVETGSVESGRWLRPGDVVTIRATGLGELTNEIVARS